MSNFIILSNRILSPSEKAKFSNIRADIDFDTEEQDLEANKSIPYLFEYRTKKQKENIIKNFPKSALVAVER